MFGHVFHYRLKCLLRSREMLFWLLLFPVLLSLFFSMAFSNIYKVEAFKKIPIAVVDSQAYQKDALLQSALNAASTWEDALFSLAVADQVEASRMLAAGEIAGYVETDGELQAVVSASGVSQTILKSFLDTFLQLRETAETVIAQNPAAVITGFLTDLAAQKEYARPMEGIPAPDTLLGYFYALLAMTCLYGSFCGLQEMNAVQANLSPQGARVSVAPVHKMKAFLAGMAASLLVQYAILLFLLTFMHFVLGVDFGTQIAYILLLCLVASLTGITLGAAVTAIARKSEAANTAILVSISMALSFFSGLMFVEMKYIIAKAFPLAAYINPATLMADGFYALYYYQTHERFFLNVALLAAFSVLFCLLAYRALRRRKYASL